MVYASIEDDINLMVLRLLELAREVTYNDISSKCTYILSEIQKDERNLIEQTKSRIKENEAKVPVSLQEQIPILQELYTNLYDVNLFIYKATKEETIIDIRYFLKSSLEEAYRTQVQGNEPMLHVKITHPPYVLDKMEKFDISWEHSI